MMLNLMIFQKNKCSNLLLNSDFYTTKLFKIMHNAWFIVLRIATSTRVVGFMYAQVL